MCVCLCTCNSRETWYLGDRLHFKPALLLIYPTWGLKVGCCLRCAGVKCVRPHARYTTKRRKIAACGAKGKAHRCSKKRQPHMGAIGKPAHTLPLSDSLTEKDTMVAGSEGRGREARWWTSAPYEISHAEVKQSHGALRINHAKTNQRSLEKHTQEQHQPTLFVFIELRGVSMVRSPTNHQEQTCKNENIKSVFTPPLYNLIHCGLVL